MPQEQGSQILLRFSSVNHPKCSMSTFLARQPVIEALQVIHPLGGEDATEPRSKKSKYHGLEEGGRGPSTLAAQDLLHSSVPIHYCVQCTLSAFLERGFLDVACDMPERAVAGYSLRSPGHQGMKCTLHPSGWMALDMDCNMYQSFGLTGHRVSGPKTLKNSTAKRRSKRCDKYVVLVKLKRLRTRTRYLERVKQAFGRINTTFKWMIAFFDKDVPVEVDLPAAFSNATLQSAHSQHICMESASVLDLPALFLHRGCSTEMPAHTLSAALPSKCTLPAKRKNTERSHTDANKQDEVQDTSMPLQCSRVESPDCESSNWLTQQPMPSAATQSAVCEYLGMLACGISPAQVVLPGVATCSIGEVHVWTWRGILGGATVTHAVEACMDGVLKGNWPWACILLHAFRNSPFAWKGKSCGDEEVQNLARPCGRNHRQAAEAGEAAGALLLLPGNHVCLLAMSGMGDNFCSFR